MHTDAEPFQFFGRLADRAIEPDSLG